MADWHSEAVINPEGQHIPIVSPFFKYAGVFAEIRFFDSFAGCTNAVVTAASGITVQKILSFLYYYKHS